MYMKDNEVRMAYFRINISQLAYILPASLALVILQSHFKMVSKQNDVKRIRWDPKKLDVELSPNKKEIIKKELKIISVFTLSFFSFLFMDLRVVVSKNAFKNN